MTNTYGLSIFGLLIFNGSLIAFSSFWCVRSTSATTYSVIGSLNKIPLSILGEFLFKEPLTNYGRLGVLVVVIGGLIYGLFSSKPVKKNPKKDEESMV